MLQLLKETISEWMGDNALRLSAALSYYSIFSIAPLVVIAIAIAGLVLGEEAAQGFLAEQLKVLLGAPAAEAVQGMVSSSSQPSVSTLAGIGGLIALLFGASGVFGQLKEALNTIWEVKPKAGQGVMKFVRERLISFGMVLAIGFLLLVSLMLTTTLAALGKLVGPLLPFSSAILPALSSLVSFAIVAVLFAAIFKFLPDAKVRWRDVWIGAIVTALLFEVGKFLLSFYLGRESTASAFGAAASAVLVLLWVYYASLILFFGAEFTQVYARATGARIQPSRNAERVAEGPGAAALHHSGKPEAGPEERLTANVPRKEHVPVLAEAGTIPEEHSPSEVRNPFAVLFAAVGGGFVAGALLRRFERGPVMSPGEHIREGSKALLSSGVAATAAGVSKAVAKTKRLVNSKELRAKRKWITRKTHDAVQGAIKRIA